MEPTLEQTEKNERLKKRLSGRRAEWVLGVISFTESSFLPILVDPVQLTMTIAKPSAWKRFALIASVMSVVGGVAGYLLGALFFETLGERVITLYSLEKVFISTVDAFNDNAFLFTFIGAFTPIPYKLVAIVGGFLKINIWAFVLASILGRGIRFFIVGFVAKYFGEHALQVFSWRFGIAATAIGVGVLAYIALLVV